MLGNFFKKKEVKTDEQIKQDREKRLAEMLVKSQALEHLIKADNTGWKEFVELLQDYIDKSLMRKALTALNQATDAEIYQLKLLDHEIYILSQFVIKIPQQFINKTEKAIEEARKQEE